MDPTTPRHREEDQVGTEEFGGLSKCAAHQGAARFACFFVFFFCFLFCFGLVCLFGLVVQTSNDFRKKTKIFL